MDGPVLSARAIWRRSAPSFKPWYISHGRWEGIPSVVGILERRLTWSLQSEEEVVRACSSFGKY